MADSPREAAAASATSASSGKPAKPVSAATTKPAPDVAALAPAASVQPGTQPVPSGDADGEGEAEELGLVLGRPDLSQNTIEELRAKNRQLKKEQKMVKQQLTNQKRKRARVMKRMRNLDTASVLQVLMDRGIELTTLGSGSAGSSTRTQREAIEPPPRSTAAAAAAGDSPRAPVA